MILVVFRDPRFGPVVFDCEVDGVFDYGWLIDRVFGARVGWRFEWVEALRVVFGVYPVLFGEFYGGVGEGVRDRFLVDWVRPGV